MGKKILITGANGFIAHHVVDHFVKKGFDVYANVRNSTSRLIIPVKKYMFNLNDEVYPDLPKFDYIIHMAAYTDVDASLNNVIPFVKDNVVATAHFFEWVKKYQNKAKVCLFSSDEVLGPAEEGEYFDESAPFKPSNPYAATKVAQEMLAYSFAHSFGLNIFRVRCMNVIGEGDNETKFIGKTIEAIKNGKKIVLHGKNKHDVASRHWIYAGDVAKIVEYLLNFNTKPNEIFHIAGKEMDVYKLAKLIFFKMKGIDMTSKDVTFVDFHKARKGHDKRYSLSNEKIKKLGFTQYTDIKEVLKKVIP